ncbi:MAG: alanine--tRNA ligase, partial [Candidatus Baltobacteraceae bacterium]
DEDNFWTMGATGPCGPCSELFYDTGEEYASGAGDTGPNLGNRFVEYWNVVFQQYNRGSDGKLAELPVKSIDTGAGFERILALVNGKASMYDTDLFLDVIAAQPKIGQTSLSAKEQRERQNIIADHARSVTFLISDGIFPSNTDRGYVLRFLIRRAIRQGRLLGYPNGFLTGLVPAVVASLEPGYPELPQNRDRIVQTLRAEEQTFDRTLERGMAMLDRLIADANVHEMRTISGQDAFALHDTYGFPFELTREIANDGGVTVDASAFEAAMDEQRRRARRDAASKRAVVSIAELPAMKSAFAGYDGLSASGEIVAILQDEKPVEVARTGDRATIVLDRTSFYAERGGQIGDRGLLTLGDGAVFEVEDTQYLGEAIGHRGIVKSGEFALGQTADAVVYDWWRREIRRHHTSAHLLQHALRDVLGDDVVQAGSWVGVDRMRFDFRVPSGALTPAQKRAVTARVNEMIRDDSPVVTRELAIEEAKQTGAIWMFGEKYGERVRVLEAGPSVEFCGGTHAHSTGELGMFLILNEFSIGSGIRRIESCVSRAAEAYVTHQQDIVTGLAGSLATTPEELNERVGKLQRDLRDVQTAVGELKARLAGADAQAYLAKAERKGTRTFVGAVVHEANSEALRHLTSALRSRLPSGVIALAGVENGTVSLLVSASDDLVKDGVHAGNLVKLAAPLVEGKGGGAPAQAQGGGKKVSGADAALGAIRDAVLA